LDFLLAAKPTSDKANIAQVDGSGTLVGGLLAEGTAESKLLLSEKLIPNVFQASETPPSLALTVS